MLQLFQAEWCPFSAVVRQRLTEHGVDYVIRQVAPYPEQRDALREATGMDTIPVVVFEDGTIVGGDFREVVAAIDERFPAGEYAEGQREQFEAHR